MAVVIKEGDPSKIPSFTFECTVCGCIFVASNYKKGDK